MRGARKNIANSEEKIHKTFKKTCINIALSRHTARHGSMQDIQTIAVANLLIYFPFILNIFSVHPR